MFGLFKRSASTSELPLAFSPTSFHIRVRLGVEEISGAETPPSDIWQRVEKKMLGLQAEGKIAGYHLYRERLNQVWLQLVQLYQAGHEEHVVKITLAEGFPSLPGVRFQISEDVLYLSLAPSSEDERQQMRSWPSSWLRGRARQELREAGIDMELNGAQLDGAQLLSSLGTEVRHVAIHRLNELPGESTAAKVYYLVQNRARGEIYAVVKKVPRAIDSNELRVRMGRIEQKIDLLSHKEHRRYRLLKDELSTIVSAAAFGPEGLGVDLPLVMLVALKLPVSATQQSVAVNAAARNESLRSVNPLEEFSAVARDDARKEGPQESVGGGQGQLFEPVPARSGAEPYLCDLTSGLATKGEDVRTYRAQPTVKEGQVVAEVRFKILPVVGRDASGHIVVPSPGETLEVPLGEGIERRGDDRFYALYAGLFSKDQQGRMCLKKALIHMGDVNLTSGDIYFGGTVEITGDVDAGVQVFAGGDLVVRGEIHGGTVRCRGDLTVEHGIVSGKSGSVQVSGHLKADFIENSNIFCGKQLTVNKALLTSQVVAGEGVVLTAADGVIGGGKVVCGLYLETANLGLKDGGQTIVHVGVDVRAERRWEIRRTRLERCLNHAMLDKERLAEIVHKHIDQLSKSQKDLKEELALRVNRWRDLISRLEVLVATAQQAIVTPSDARIKVTGLLAQNCLVRISGDPVALSQDLLGVMIETRKHQDSHLRALTA